MAGGAVTVVQPFLAGLVLSVAFVPLCRVMARRTGLVAHPRNDRWHREIVPLLGGVAIALATLVGTLITDAAADAIVPLSAAMAISVMGLVDDAFALKPATKLIGQIVLAAAVVYAGYRLNWLDSRLLDSVVTMVWLVGLTNAFNLLDNMDGLCAGTALIVSMTLIIGLASGAASQAAGPEIAFLSVLAGAVAGFLIYNFPPASIFMGDSGSLLLGFSLATLTLNNEGVRGSRSDVLSAIAAPVFVLLLPIFDTTLVTVLRLLAGRSPAVGGRDHSSHRLVALGISERSAVFVLWFLAAGGGAIGILLRRTSAADSLAIGAVFLVLMCGFAYFLARVRVYDDQKVPASASPITPIDSEFFYKRRAAEVMLDFGLVAAAYYAATRLRFSGVEAYLENAENFYATLPVVLATQLVAFFIVGMYRGTWHHFKQRDWVTFAKGVTLGAAAAQAVVLVVYGWYSYSISVFAIYAVLLAVMVTLSRGVVRRVERLLDRLLD